MLLRVACACLAAVVLVSVPLPALTPDVVQSMAAVPPEVAGRLVDPVGFQQAASGQYFLFDRRGHTVYGLDADLKSVWQIVQIGAEPGRIIEPIAFSVAADGTFVVADAPDNRERIQIFTPVGFRTGGFVLRSRLKPRVILDNMVASGTGSLQYNGQAILISQPESGALFSEYNTSGTVVQVIGTLRYTGHEDDPELHFALNSGLPLRDPTGGFFFVFLAGEPVLRKYDHKGQLLFERRIYGREIDEFVTKLPTTWPRRKTTDGELPYVPPTIRTAAVDPHGRLWVSFVLPYVYVFDPTGDKIRSLQFRGAGLLSPNSLFFGGQGQLLVTPGLYLFPALTN